MTLQLHLALSQADLEILLSLAKAGGGALTRRHGDAEIVIVAKGDPA